MSKYRHMTEHEVVSHIEKFGTEEERDLLDKLQQELDWSECPECESLASELDCAENKIVAAVEALS